MVDHMERDVDAYIRKGNYIRACYEAGTIDDFGDCRFCGVPIGTGGCHACLRIAGDSFALEDYMDEL